MAKKSVAVFDRNGMYLSHCTYERANKLVNNGKATFIGVDTIRLRKSKIKAARQRKDIAKEEGYRCYICNFHIVEHEDLSVDHLIAKSRDKEFADIKFNKRCCCVRCNQDKGNQTLVEYVKHIKENRQNYTYISDKRLCYLERYAIQHEKDYYAITRSRRIKGGDKFK